MPTRTKWWNPDESEEAAVYIALARFGQAEKEAKDSLLLCVLV